MRGNPYCMEEILHFPISPERDRLIATVRRMEALEEVLKTIQDASFLEEDAYDVEVLSIDGTSVYNKMCEVLNGKYVHD